MTTTVGETGVDLTRLKRLVAERPDEVRWMMSEIDRLMPDKRGRTIHKLDKVTTSDGEVGLVVRLDKNTNRVLVRLPNDRFRLLRSHRVEVRRGRPPTVS